MLKPEIKEQIVGLAEVREVFRSSKFGTVAGCLVVEGYIKRGNPVRVLRDNVVIHQGELDSLRRFKDDVERGARRHRMRHRRAKLQRHPRRRPDRVLSPASRSRATPEDAPCHASFRARGGSPSRCSACWARCCGARCATRASSRVTITHVKVSPDLAHAWVLLHAALRGLARCPAARDPRRGGGVSARSARAGVAPAARSAPALPARPRARARQPARRADHAGRTRGRGPPRYRRTGEDGADDAGRELCVRPAAPGAAQGGRHRAARQAGGLELERGAAARAAALGRGKAGHAGTLDPWPPACCRCASARRPRRAANRAGFAKAYRVAPALGASDRYRRSQGAVVSRAAVPALDAATVRGSLAGLAARASRSRR